MTNEELRHNIATLQEEIPMLDNQIETVDEFLDSDAFQDTVPEFQAVIDSVEAYKAAVERYKAEATKKIDEWSAALRGSAVAQATAPVPAGCPVAGQNPTTQAAVQLVSGLLNLFAQAAKQ